MAHKNTGPVSRGPRGPWSCWRSSGVPLLVDARLVEEFHGPKMASLEFGVGIFTACLLLLFAKNGESTFQQLTWWIFTIYISQIVGLKHRFGECVKKTQNHWNSWKATLRKKRVTPPCATQDPESKYSRLHVGFNFGRPELCVLLQLCVTYDLNRVISSPSTQQKSLIATIMGLGHSICGSNWLLIFIGNMDTTAAPNRLFPDLS